MKTKITYKLCKMREGRLVNYGSTGSIETRQKWANLSASHKVIQCKEACH